MLRLKLAFWALASGVLVTLSGCRSACDEEPMFPRLFRSNRYPVMTEGGDCPCQHASGSPQLFDMPAGQGPFLAPPPAPAPPPPGAIPIMNPQGNLPPILNKGPQAVPVPYNP